MISVAEIYWIVMNYIVNNQSVPYFLIKFSIGTIFLGIKIFVPNYDIFLFHFLIFIIQIIGLSLLISCIMFLQDCVLNKNSFDSWNLFESKSDVNDVELAWQPQQSSYYDSLLQLHNPIFDKIIKVLSDISKLQLNKDLDNHVFIKFNLLYEQFNLDCKQLSHHLKHLNDSTYDANELTLLLEKYLDLFNEQYQIIQHHVESCYNDEIVQMHDKLCFI